MAQTHIESILNVLQIIWYTPSFQESQKTRQVPQRNSQVNRTFFSSVLGKLRNLRLFFFFGPSWVSGFFHDFTFSAVYACGSNLHMEVATKHTPPPRQLPRGRQGRSAHRLPAAVAPVVLVRVPQPPAAAPTAPAAARDDRSGDGTGELMDRVCMEWKRMILLCFLFGFSSTGDLTTCVCTKGTTPHV